MKLYLYCSYTHSKRGFVMTRLQGEELTPANLSCTQDVGEKIVNSFFTNDVFRILWQEYPGEDSLPVLPKTEGGMFGICGLRGPIEDRNGSVNFALLADREEVPALNRIAAGVLADPEGFALALCRCLSIGGVCGYRADAKTLRELLTSLHDQNADAEQDEKSQLAYSVRELLKYAVYVGSWEQASEYLHPRWIWKIRPKQALSQEEFAELRGRDIWR